jgi:hypothetical protein
LADYVVRLDLAIVALVAASAAVTFVVDWIGESRVKERFSWRHWWHFPILSAATLLVGWTAGFMIDLVTQRVFGIWAIWGLSPVGLVTLWFAAFGLIHFIWSVAQLRERPLIAA